MGSNVFIPKVLSPYYTLCPLWAPERQAASEGSEGSLYPRGTWIVTSTQTRGRRGRRWEKGRVLFMEDSQGQLPGGGDMETGREGGAYEDTWGESMGKH